MFDFFDGKRKVVIGMVHIGALPGTPLYDEKGGMAKLIENAAADLEHLQAGGVDAVMFGNENDRPYSLKAPVSSVAAMSAVISTVKHKIRIPFGVNYLWDPTASVALAAATGAKFVREIFTGVYASDMGLWVPACDDALKARRNLDVRGLKLLFNINAEFAASLDTRPLPLRAKSAVFSSLADAILVSGPITGQETNQSELSAVANTVKDVPVLANTGVNINNVADILSVASGCVVGTHFKVNGNTWNMVDPERVKAFMKKVETLR